MAQLKRDNHFVPQLYLKQWSEDSTQIFSYRTIVSHERVPEWKLRSIRGVAFHRDLYTTIENGLEIDQFEQWIEAEFETPAQEALDKVLNERNLTTLDWERLALFLAAQDVRTPTNYLESMKRWRQQIPEILNGTLKELVNKLEKAHQEGRLIETNKNRPKFFRDIAKVKVIPNVIQDQGKGLIHTEVVAGRNLWLESQRFLLTKTAKVLKKHKWSIVEPANGRYWFTSDHPVVRLNYYGNGAYDLKGGWGNQNANLLMPLSPRHLLFTHIGSDAPDRFTFSVEKTFEIQKFIAERALRWIFAHKPMSLIAQLRPRHVDAVAVKA
ncbi:MAG: DUF4238 domain-containing protein, partial [Desulfobacterales bacterium]|nr:DUF4238 domain-containing protein [Desulfobacterales bacterium]